MAEEAPKVKRRADGTFPKGVSGHAGRGTRKKGSVHLSEIVNRVMLEESSREAGKARIEVIIRDFAVAIEDPEVPLKERRALFDTLADRGYGKAVQAIQHDSEMEIRFVERNHDSLGDPAALAATRAAVADSISASEALADHDGSPGGQDDAASPDGDGGSDEDA